MSHLVCVLLSVPPEVSLFSPFLVTEKVLLRILRHPDVIQEVKFNDSDKRSPTHFVYQRGRPVDYFILILQVRPLREHFKVKAWHMSFFTCVMMTHTLKQMF